MTFTNDLDSQLFEFETQIYKQLTHVFTVEAFEDWLYDMECTEWDYYDASSNDWKTALVSKGVNNVLANLLKFQNDIETDAYKKVTYLKTEAQTYENGQAFLLNICYNINERNNKHDLFTSYSPYSSLLAIRKY